MANTGQSSAKEVQGRDGAEAEEEGKADEKETKRDFEEQETVSKKVSAGKKRKRTDEAEVRCCTVCFGEGGGRGREDEKKGRNTT